MENEKETVFSILGDVLTTLTQIIEFYVLVLGGAIFVHNLIRIGWIKLDIEPEILQAIPSYALMVLAFGSLLRVALAPFIQLPPRVLYAIHRAYLDNK